MRRLWLSVAAVAVAAVLVAAVPLLVTAAVRDPYLLAAWPAAARGGGSGVSPCLQRRGRAADRPPGGGAGRSGGPARYRRPAPGGAPVRRDRARPGSQRAGCSALRRVTNLLTADREPAIDASHQLRTPLTALSMRLEEMIASADDPDAVREEGTAALAQAERLAEVVTQLLSPARRVGALPTRADQRGQDRAAADHRMGAGLPAGRAQDGARRRVPAARLRHPGRARPGDRNAAGQRPDARQGDGDDPPHPVGQLGRHRGRG